MPIHLIHLPSVLSALAKAVKKMITATISFITASISLYAISLERKVRQQNIKTNSFLIVGTSLNLKPVQIHPLCLY